MKKITFLVFAMSILCWQTNAQLVSDDTCTTSFVDISGTGTDLSLGDDTEANITASFAFELDGVSSSDLRVGNNGGILFNATTGDVSTSNSPTAQGFYPLATDIGDGGQGAVYWEETGTAPNRVLIVQWNDRPHYDSASFGVTPGGATFQVQLYETTNDIRFIYTDLDFGDPTYDDGITAGVHVIGANGTYTYSLESSLAGISCVAWSVPSCPFPSALSATNITADSAELGWTENGTATAWDIELGLDGFTPTGTPTTSGVTNPYTAMSLTDNTDYDYYVRADCTGGDLSEWVGPFSFTTLELCPTPSALGASMITDSSAELSWTENGTATAWDIELGLDGFTPTGTPTTSGVTNPYTAMSLTDNTDYDYYVRADCGGVSGVSAWAGPYSFTTACSPTSVDYIADFSNNVPDNCWYEAGSGEVADGPMGIGASDWKSGRAFTDGNSNVVNSNVINLWQNVDREWLVSPTFDLDAFGGPVGLKVIVAVTNYSFSGTSTASDTDTMGSDDEVQLLMTSDGGSSWVNITTWNVGNQPAVTGTGYVFDLSSMSGQIQFALFASDGTTDDTEDYDFHIGSFEVSNAVLSTNELENEAAFTYYPNPVKNTLTLNAQNNIENVRMYNMLGQEVMNVKPQNVDSELDMSRLDSGAYFVQVTIAGITETVRVIKQ